jgi:hypothetical protein
MSYFGRYVYNLPHPCMAATGTEGRCELCGHGPESALHDPPYYEKKDRE